MRNPLKESDIGKISPRTFVHYTYREGRVPDPVEYRESLENSFPPEELKRFVRKMYQLLLHNRFPWKSRKICVYGPTNSGKNSCFSPIETLIGMENMAYAVNEGRFAAQLINENTKCVLIDEWIAGKSTMTLCKCCKP